MITKIIQIADIHIRLFKHHREYQAGFKKLFKFIEEIKDENTAIGLIGDIVHNKTDLSPELIQVTSQFLKGCADLLPTILIAGNHDLNCANLNRLDALTPIVNSLNHPNLHYWKNSGVYKLGGISFSVLGIADSPDNWVMARNITAKTKIALHHGSVQGSFTDAEHEILTGITLDHFKNFDISLLGDIHKTQYLNEEKTIAYVGSLFQQNYGESVDGHGIIVWDVKKRKGEFVEIPNDYAYVTFDLIDGTCIVPDKLPKNLRVRIRHENSTSEQIEDFVKRLGKKYSIIELIKQKSSNSQLVERQKTEILGNSRKVDYQNKCISDYLSAIEDISVEEISEVTKLNEEINKLLPVNNAQRNVTWKPIKLEFSNMFSYGENNSVEFDNLRGSYGIWGKNAQGKSSLLNILTFSLYDKTPVASKANHILNNSRENFYCKIEFELNGNSFFIERIGTKKKDGNVKVDVNFWTMDENGEKINLNGEDRDKTNFAIRNYVGTYDDFVLTALSTQYDNQNFIEKTQRDRKDLLYKFLDITVYDELFKLAKEESKECQALIRDYERDDLHAKSSQLYGQINEKQVELDEIEIRINENKLELKDENDRLIELNKIYHPVSNELNLDEIETSIGNIVKSIQFCITDLENVKKQIEEKTELIKEIKNEIKGFKNIQLFDEINHEYNSLNNDHRITTNELESVKRQLIQCQQQEILLHNHKYDPNCEYCIDNKLVKEAQKSIEKIPELTEAISILETLFSKQVSELAEIKNKLETSRQLKSLQDSLIKSESELKFLKEQQKTLKYKGKSINESLKEAKKNKEQYLKNSAQIEKNAEILENISLVNGIIIKREKVEKELQNNQKLIHISLEGLKAKYDECNLKLDKYLQFVKRYRIYDLYLQSISREGVPYRILEGILPVIENEVNQILSSLVNFTVRLEANDDKYIHAFIVYPPPTSTITVEGSNSWPVELSSGMERFILSLAFRCSLSEITSLPKANFLAIDEGFGVLDSENLLSIGNLFGYLKKQYDFLVCISHIDSMKDLVDKQIKIEKINGFSKINFQD